MIQLDGRLIGNSSRVGTPTHLFAHPVWQTINSFEAKYTNNGPQATKASSQHPTDASCKTEQELTRPLVKIFVTPDPRLRFTVDKNSARASCCCNHGCKGPSKSSVPWDSLVSEHTAAIQVGVYQPGRTSSSGLPML